MKLEGVHNRTLFASSCRSVFAGRTDCELEKIGRLPDSTDGFEQIQFQLTTSRYWKPIVEAVTGDIHSINVWPLSKQELLANANRWVFHSSDGGSSWDHVLTLPDSSGVRGILPSAFEEHEGCLYLGEYISTYDGTPKILRSDDGGRSWSIFLTLEDARHIHAIESDPYGGALWITTGDTDSGSKIGRVRDGTFDIVGTGSQRWRTVGLEFTMDAIVWGMDCPYAEQNYIFRLDRERFNGGEPQELHSTAEAIYYSAKVSSDNTTWLFFSTGGGVRPDATAPDATDQRAKPVSVDVWGSSSESDFTDWQRVASYSRRTTLMDRIGFKKYSTNAYVFIEGHEEDGLYINPYNTATDAGEIINVPFSQLRTTV